MTVHAVEPQDRRTCCRACRPCATSPAGLCLRWPDFPIRRLHPHLAERLAAPDIVSRGLFEVMPGVVSQVAPNLERALQREPTTDRHLHARRPDAARAAGGGAFRRLFHNSPVPMWVYDRETLRFLEVNEAAVQVLGWSRETLLGMTILDIRPAEEHEQVRRIATDPRPARQVSGPWRQLDAAGRERLVEVVSHLTEFAGRSAVLVAARDVTDRLRAEAAQRDSEERLRLAQEVGQVGTWDRDLCTGVLLWSESCHALFGTDPAIPPTYELWRRTVHPEDLPAVEAALRDALAGETVDWRTEYRVVRPSDGALRWMACRGRIVRDPATGQALRLLGVTLDITERKTTEAFWVGQAAVLELIAAGRPLAEVLTALCHLAEAKLPEARCSVLLLDPAQGRLWLGAAPSLPARYNAAIDGLAIGPRAGSCGTAAYRKERVVVADIARDPLWAEYRAAAAAHGLRACWSEPVLSRAGAVLGTFAVYYATPRAPTEAEVARLEVCRHLAAVAIERQRAEAALAASERRYRALTEAGAIAMWRADPAGMIVEGQGWSRLTGQSQADLRARGWLAVVHPEDHDRVLAAWTEGFAARRATATEQRIRTIGGDWRWVRARGVPVFGEEGELTEWAGVIEDVHERRSAEAEARRLALHDPLTGLPNRRQLNAQGPALLARARQQGAAVAVLALDLDRFKPINDLHGHAAGDAVLRAAAERLRGILREGDTVARTGGDEFVVAAALEAGAAEAAARLARRILAALSEPVPLDGGEMATIGASLGVALTEARGAAEFEQLLRQADAALYRAKAEGRGTFRFHTKGMDALRRARARTEAELRRAIAAGEIEPHYQPLVDLGSGRIEGFEVLARWQHPRRGLLLPGEFIAVAEDAGLIGPLTEAVLRRAAAEAVRWETSLPIAVNLSALLLHDAGLAGRVLGVLAEAGLPPERLEVEVTETAVATDPERARRVAGALQAAGVRLAMDDFGTGYSSLANLRALPFDRIKIDRSFIAGLGDGDDAEGEEIVTAIVALGRSLGLPTVAEGIENAATARRARALGCRVGQGWYFGRPVPATEVPALLAASARLVA